MYEEQINNEDMNEDVLKQGRSDNALLGQEVNVQHEKMSCNICVSHAAHRQKYTDARFEYQREKDPEAVYFTADMQKVIVLPKLTTKAHSFVSRLVTFNERFAPMNSEFPDYCILWHEIVVVIWADNCSGQNKNWFLFTSFVQCVITWGPNSITMKYLEKNHTFMAADNVHGSIGKTMTAIIANFQGFVDLCDKSAMNIKVIPLDITDFYDITKENRARKSHNKTSIDIPKLETMVKFTKG